MSYIGREPTVGNFQVCDAISVVNNQAAYTMQVSSVNVIPETANHCLVSLNGILQAPGSSFTVAGSTITFASALVTNDVINFIQILGSVLDLGVPSDDTVSIAKLTASGTKNSTTFLRGDNTFNTPPLGGITVADMWRVTANKSTSTSANVIDSNLEQCDTGIQGTLGSAMSVSSGLFTFPSTGIWLIMANITFTNASNNNAEYVEIKHQTTSNNGTAYADTAYAYAYFNSLSSTLYSHATTMEMLDITNVSTHKIRFAVQSAQAANLLGGTNENYSTLSFIRLGDT